MKKLNTIEEKLNFGNHINILKNSTKSDVEFFKMLKVDYELGESMAKRYTKIGKCFKKLNSIRDHLPGDVVMIEKIANAIANKNNTEIQNMVADGTIKGMIRNNPKTTFSQEILDLAQNYSIQDNDPSDIALIKLINTGVLTQQGGNYTRIKRIAQPKNADFLIKVLNKEMTISAAEAEIRIREGRVTTPKVTQELVDDTYYKLEAMLNKKQTANLSPFEQTAFLGNVLPFKEIFDKLPNAHAKQMSQTILTVFNNMEALVNNAIEKGIQDALPKEINIKTKSLQRREKELKRKECMAAPLSERIPKADLQYIRKTLHPDYAPNEYKDKFTKVSAIINKACVS